MGQCDMGEVKVTSSHGYLSNYIADTTSCGSITSPWVISGSPGQHITLSFYDFTIYPRQTHLDPGGRAFSPTVCHNVFATIEDSGVRESICDQRERYRPVYISKGHQIVVTFEMQDEVEPSYVLLYYRSKFHESMNN